MATEGNDPNGIPRGDGAILLETDQRGDAFTHRALGPYAGARLLFQRCREAREQALPAQDYALVAARPDGSSLTFCVCDGVGSSYKGNFAAAFLARRLVATLAALSALPATPDAVESRLTAALAEWAAEAQAELRGVEIGGTSGPLVREVLEELRESHGSETVFFAGRVDLAVAEDVPVRALLCWMGNLTAYLFTSETDGAWIRPQDDANRWSTRRGVRGRLSVRVHDPLALTRLIVHTDGCDALSKEIAFLDDDELRRRAAALLPAAGSDDVTVLDVQWEASVPSPLVAERDTDLG